MDEFDYHDTPLGKNAEYPNAYDSGLLVGIPRELGRKSLDIDGDSPLPFFGVDVWNAYEVSWLNSKNKPMVAIAQIQIPCDSSFLVESKSLKLYFNSFNNHVVSSVKDLHQNIVKDLSQCVQAEINMVLVLPSQWKSMQVEEPKGICLDQQDISLVFEGYDPSLLKPISSKRTQVTESVYSHLLKSNCLVTGQPDWATVSIDYQGPQIDHESLLRYLVSFRNHQEFHEQCVERIFVDLLTWCSPEKLAVSANYLRRGGIDINPYRSNGDMNDRLFKRYVRQ